jgi:NADPH:quinone reductase-like Zn-dependent oxidoreductase
MQAVMYEQFGDASVLSVREIPVPQPGRSEVLVRVRMASLNPVDLKLRHGMLRMLGRPRRPAITGKDFAGEIVGLGADVAGYSIGERVFGSVDPMGGQGTCAQFVALSTDLIAPTPGDVVDEVAASLPVASGTALQTITYIANLQRGQSILITGASGGVGASAVQIARSLGARITGVCSTAHIDYVRAMGAERVIDYRKESWLQGDEKFDVIFDAAAAASFAVARPHLTTTGIYINTMPGPKLIWEALVAKLSSRRRCVPFLLKTDTGLLQRLAKLAGDGVIAPHIEEIVELDQVAAAQRRMEEGGVHGKLCVRIAA